MENDPVSHPYHYTWLRDVANVEPIDICSHFDFCLGNALKYILRAGHKPIDVDGSPDYVHGCIQDLQKAVFYLNYKINSLKEE